MIRKLVDSNGAADRHIGGCRQVARREREAEAGSDRSRRIDRGRSSVSDRGRIAKLGSGRQAARAGGTGGASRSRCCWSAVLDRQPDPCPDGPRELRVVRRPIRGASTTQDRTVPIALTGPSSRVRPPGSAAAIAQPARRPPPLPAHSRRRDSAGHPAGAAAGTVGRPVERASAPGHPIPHATRPAWFPTARRARRRDGRTRKSPGT